jgi:hypothetical protein
LNAWIFCNVKNSVPRKYVGIVCSLAGPVLWYAIFQWNSIDYPSYAKGPCYSPNHAYYVTRHQTLWEAMNISSPHDFGTARLYDRSGRLLYEKETLVDGEFGPEWLGGFKDDPTNRPKVFYQGTEEPGWTFDLPEYPGKSNSNKSCYPTKIE